ncbi:MAG: XRE family transcriptional regulator [Agrobacterium cavarae]
MSTIPEKIRAIMKSTGMKQMQLAERLEVSQSTVNRWLAGAEPEGHRRDAINEMYDQVVEDGPKEQSGTIVPVVGLIGAGGQIEPEYEQSPPEGLDQIWIPFELDDDLIAFEVKGISMMPVYREGHVIICYREQKRPIDFFYGVDAAVTTSDGRRYLKTIIKNGSNIDLYSFNADPIPNVKLAWIGEIFAAMPRSAVRRIEKRGGIQGSLHLT